MKMTCLACGLISFSLLAAPASAALLVYEGFDYASGNLADKAGGSGFSAAWVASGTSLVVPSPSVPLTYTGITSVGNSVVDNNTSATRANTRTWNTAGYVDDGDVLWFSALFRKGSATSSDLKVGFVSGADPITEAVGFQVNATGTVAAHIASLNSASTLSYSGSPTATHLVVGRLNFSSTAGADSVTVWLDPDLTSTPSAGGVSLNGTFPVGNYVTVRGGTSWSGWTDELRVGGSFADVVPEPASLSVLSVGAALILRRRRA